MLVSGRVDHYKLITISQKSVRVFLSTGYPPRLETCALPSCCRRYRLTSQVFAPTSDTWKRKRGSVLMMFQHDWLIIDDVCVFTLLNTNSYLYQDKLLHTHSFLSAFYHSVLACALLRKNHGLESHTLRHLEIAYTIEIFRIDEHIDTHLESQC